MGPMVPTDPRPHQAGPQPGMGAAGPETLQREGLLDLSAYQPKSCAESNEFVRLPPTAERISDLQPFRSWAGSNRPVILAAALNSYGAVGDCCPRNRGVL